MSDPLQDRQVRRRLAVLRHAEEVTGNVAMTCRYYGISRQCYYTWLRRFDAEGPEGLRDRSHRPHHSPNATEAEVVEKIVHLRRHYHFGPAKIVMYLARYHDVTISVSGVWRILKRLGLNRLPASQRYQRHDRRWKRYEKAQPGHRVQIDVKFIEALPATSPKVGKDPAAAVAAPASGSEHIVETTGLTARRRRRFYQFTAIDDCTRLRVLKVYPRSDQKTAVAFLDHVLARLPFKVEVIQTDNGAEFQSAFHWHALDQGLQHVYIKPRTPRLNGKVERSHRIDAEEFYRLLEGVVIDDSKSFDDKLREWEDYDNYHRPHGGLGGQTPYERLRQKTNKSTAQA
ncbi:IS481 family transposase [Pseudonocardia sp. WMMC193]|uniref:IS481 family transposase n=1 Tax=Pseudonocardia sp. WMMC193 TaxID=2911965 RepID=UPI001EFFECE1|nr:IS481 family transposase [Pseudonocardia sp. WMMC193]MCF7547610.1 IS481 family transposase [Pseudonocardia sp. WMMC193]